MPELRCYPDLATLLTYETDAKDPEQAAITLIDGILKYAPDFEYLVMYVGPDPEHPWILMPVPSEAIPNLEHAATSFTGFTQHPVAYWKRS